MKLRLHRSLWTNGFDLDAAIEDCRSGAFDGIEGPVPEASKTRVPFVQKLRGSGLPFIAEVVTGTGYVPSHRDVERHLEDFQRQLDAAAMTSPQFVTALVGCDAWSIFAAIDFLGHAIDAARERLLRVSFETHRSRATFTPWTTAELVRQLPELELTCDFSHWCCVCERLVLNEEPELLKLFASRARHVHARVGYDQGPQVPHPAAPAYRAALEAHEQWWTEIWRAQERSGFLVTTMTPEFGPDGYLQVTPFTDAPVASLDEINHWMATRQRERFALRAPIVSASQ